MNQKGRRGIFEPFPHLMSSISLWCPHLIINIASLLSLITILIFLILPRCRFRRASVMLWVALVLKKGRLILKQLSLTLFILSLWPYSDNPNLRKGRDARSNTFTFAGTTLEPKTRTTLHQNQISFTQWSCQHSFLDGQPFSCL